MDAVEGSVDSVVCAGLLAGRGASAHRGLPLLVVRGAGAFPLNIT